VTELGHLWSKDNGAAERVHETNATTAHDLKYVHLGALCRAPKAQGLEFSSFVMARLAIRLFCASATKVYLDPPTNDENQSLVISCSPVRFSTLHFVRISYPIVEIKLALDVLLEAGECLERGQLHFNLEISPLEDDALPHTSLTFPLSLAPPPSLSLPLSPVTREPAPHLPCPCCAAPVVQDIPGYPQVQARSSR